MTGHIAGTAVWLCPNRREGALHQVDTFEGASGKSSSAFRKTPRPNVATISEDSERTHRKKHLHSTRSTRLHLKGPGVAPKLNNQISTSAAPEGKTRSLAPFSGNQSFGGKKRSKLELRKKRTHYGAEKRTQPLFAKGDPRRPTLHARDDRTVISSMTIKTLRRVPSRVFSITEKKV